MPKNNTFQFRYELRMQAQSDEAEVLIYGQIVSHKYSEDSPDVTARDFDKLLKDAKAQGATKLRLRINSPGGYTWQAVAMRTMLLTSEFETISVDIEGLCASAATLFVCLPDAHVRIAEGSEFMIHNPSVLTWGTARDLEREAERMRKQENEFCAMYAKRCQKDESQIKMWMDEETWFTAKEAVENGFCDEVLEAEEIAACVTPEVMSAMNYMYKHVPDAVLERDETREPISNAEPKAATGDATEHTHNEEEEQEMETMNVKDITLEQLRAENPALHAQIMQAGAENERERIQEIDALTPAGYEEMAMEAKQNGTSAMDYHKAIVKAQREKGTSYLAARKKETEPAAQVKGGASADPAVSEDDELKAYAKGMGEIAVALHNNASGMY